MNSSFLRYSSITKKIWMSLLGLFLMVFLIVHLGINLCLLRNDPTWFNDAAYFMGTNYIIKVFEVILFGGFILHILFAIILQLRNWRSRPVRYNVNPRTDTPFFSKYMIYTGTIVLIFLVLHLMDFYFIRLGWKESPIPALPNGHPDFYILARWLFRQPFYTIFYIIMFVVLSVHLYHSFRAAFQSLGLNHKSYNPSIEIFGIVYSIVIPLGYILIPIYYLI
jgi:succinate dehydrogenase / fumarate reductase, cytochrome b subunit